MAKPKNFTSSITFLETLGARRRESEQISSPEIMRAPKKLWRSEVIGGFTLVEMLVSVSVLGLIMSVALYNYGTFNDDLVLSSAGQEIAIAMRQAQTYGLTVKEVSTHGGVFSSAYGIYFDTDTEPTSYYIFADTNSNFKFENGNGCGSGAGPTECVEKFNLRNGVKVTDVCNQSACSGVLGVKMMDVTFLRPNPDARIYFSNSSGVILAGPSLTGKIILTSPKGKSLTITVESTGQVSVE